MRLSTTCILALACAFAFVTTEARSIRVRPIPQEQEDDTIQYYAADPQEDDDQGVVYISSSDQYNGLYGQQASRRQQQQQQNYPQPSRGLSAHKSVSKPKETARQPPVQTIRNYNKVNDDGSFTFGYEAADGSFKEETRGTDCVVRGKYGYVDPDGNKREFTYVSGNPCDPNAPKEEDELDGRPDNSNENENVPANYPTRPIRPIRPVTVAPKPAVTLFQSNYGQEEDEQPEPEQVLKPQPIQQIRSRPSHFLARPQYLQDEAEEEPQIYSRPRIHPSVSSTTPSSILYKHSETPLTITPRPVSVTTPRPTTYRPQLLQVAVTPKPSPFYTKTVSPSVRPTLSSFASTRGSLDFDAEFQKFQTENNAISPSPKPALKSSQKYSKPAPSSSPNYGNGQVYSSELVFDPASGQYKTQLYQTLPQTEGDFTVNQQIQPYVHQPQPQLVNVQELQQRSPLYRQSRPQTSQALYQQQQQEIQFQNSAQLYAQQQRARTQQQPQPNQHQTSPQQFYYIQPSNDQHGVLGGGQIDAFLRGHNIQF